MERSTTPTTRSIDPVCGMEVYPGRTRLVAIYLGHSYWFCSEGCREAFETNPQKCLELKPEKRKGWLGRYVNRRGRANKKRFDGVVPNAIEGGLKEGLK